MVIMEDPYRKKRQRRAREIEQLKAAGARRGEVHDDAYWALVYDFEHAPWVTDHELLTNAGVDMPRADDLSESRLTECLWNVVERLASWQVYLMFTDHLSDRELYTRLTERTLREPRRDIVPGHGVMCVYDLLDVSEVNTFLRYYANDEERADWETSGDLDDTLPPKSDPPYDRDRFLPKPDPTAERTDRNEGGAAT